MKKIIIIAFIFVLFPMSAWSDYDHDAIKNGFTVNQEIFQITGWKKTENGEAWRALTELKGAVISVGKKNAGVIMSVADSNQALIAMLVCAKVGEIGLEPQNETHRSKIFDVIQSSIKNLKPESLKANSAVFDVNPIEVSGNVFLTYMLKPAT